MSLLTILEIFLAIVFIMAGLMKLMTPKTQLAMKMKWVSAVSAPQLKLIGLLEVLGALALVLPFWMQLDPRLTLLAVTGLTVLMLCAFVFHLKRKEGKEALLPFVLMLLAGYLSYSLMMLA